LRSLVISPGYISFRGGKIAGIQVCKKPLIQVIKTNSNEPVVKIVHESKRTEYPDKSKVTELKILVPLLWEKNVNELFTLINNNKNIV